MPEMPNLPIPDLTELPLYLNIAFFSILGLGMLFGFLRGFKKSLYAFIVTVIFYVIFFLTIEMAVNALWSLQLPFLGGLLANLNPAFASVTSLSEAVPLALSIYVPSIPEAVLANPNLLEFVAGLAIFIVKIVYTIIYFTVIQIIYRLLTFIIRVIFFNTPKSERKYRSQNRGFGAVFGLLSGVLSLFVTFIIMGGVMSIGESLLVFAPEIPEAEEVTLHFPRQGIYEASQSVIPLQNEEDPMAGFAEAVAMLQGIVDSYNSNILVSLSSQLTISDTDEQEAELSLYLFDSVLSFTYKEEKIAIRDELAVYASVAGTILNSPFMETMDLADIDGELIQTAMNELADSHLFTSILPLAIDVGSEFMEIDIPVDKEAIYEIDWKTEIMQIGEVAALVFDFINTAGLLEENPDFETVIFDGDMVRDIFDALGDSQLVTLAAYVAVQPLLQGLADDNPVKAIITVPEDLNWKDEFSAMGEIIGAVLDTSITYAQIQSGDPLVIIQALAQLDFTVLLQSKIITNALINVLSGAGGLLDGEQLAFLKIPANISWLDELDGDGNIIKNGELRNILQALNQLAQVAANIDFGNINATSITELTDDAINALFESRILVASITEAIRTLEFGEMSLLIPDSAFDDEGYLLKTELVAVVTALKTIISALPCDEGDEECAAIGFDYEEILTLSSDDIDTVFASLILEATIGNMVLELGGDMLVVPQTPDVIALISVDGIEREIVAAAEIKKVFAAVGVFEITSFADIEFDESMILEIAADEDKIDTILDSKIIAATAGNLLYDMGGDVLTIPNATIEVITVGGEAKSIVDAAEIKRLLLAVATLEITSLEGMEIGPDILKNLATETDQTVLDEDKADKLFASLILQATISKILIDLVGGEAPVLTIPYFSETGATIRYETEEDDFEWIHVDELTALIQAILILDITDFENLDIDSLDLDLILDNASVILESAILQATISDQIMNLETDMIVVPEYDLLGEELQITTGTGAKATTFIAKGELELTLEAIGVLDIDLQNPDFDETIINKLASDSIPGELDDDKLDTLLASSIIHASMSNMIIDLTEGDGETAAVIVVPHFAENGSEVRLDDGHGVEYISKTELINLFKAYYALDIEDFNSVDSLEISTILAKFDTIILSATLHATISDQVINMESDAVVVPEFNLDEEAIIIIVGAGETATTYVSSQELRATFDALDVLGIDFSNPAFDATLISNLEADDDPSVLDEDKLDTLFASTIIHASISKMLLDLTEAEEGESSILTVPYYDAFNLEVRFSDDQGCKYISEAELRNALAAMHALDISDFNNVESLELQDISANFDVLIASAILHATISEQVINMESEAIVVPEFDLDDNPVIIVVGAGVTETTYISETELRATFDALDVMGIDFNNPAFDASLVNNLESASDPDVLDETKLDTSFAWVIIDASISKMRFDLTEAEEGESAILSVPYYDSDDTAVRVDDGRGIEYVTETELRSVLAALHALDITDFNNVESLTLQDINSNFPVLIASAILHATISDQLLTLESDDVVIPHYGYDGVSIRITVGLLDQETVYIGKNELEHTFTALDLLGVNDLTNVDIAIDLTDFYAPDNRDTLLASAIVHAAISKQLLELEELTVPHFDIADNPIRLLRGSLVLDTATEYVVDTEIHALFEVLEVLNITDLDNVNIDLNLADFYEPEEREILMDSASVHLEISNQLIGLGPETLAIPHKDSDDGDIRMSVGDELEQTASEYVVKAEIHALFEVLEKLNISDLDNVNITIDLTDFYTEADRNILLDSASVHAEISKQVLDIDDATLDVPFYSEAGLSIRIIRGVGLEATEYLVKDEVHALFEVLEFLNISDLETVNMDMDLTDLYVVENRTILLASASVHLKMSSQMLELATGDEPVLVIPDSDIDGNPITVLRVNHDDLIDDVYLKQSEIHYFFEGLEILDLPIDNIDEFDGSFDLSILYVHENRVELLKSASLHATISDQLIKLDTDGTIVIPDQDVLTSDVRLVVAGTEFIVGSEIHAFFDGIEELGLVITNVNEFDGSFNLGVMYGQDSRDMILTSATLHATISDQLIKLDTEKDVVVMPEKDVDDVAIQLSIAGTAFVIKAEIDFFFEGLEELGLIINDVNEFDGSFHLGVMYAQESRDIIMASAALHATISEQLIKLDTDGTIIMPDQDIAAVDIRLSVSGTQYIIKTEIDYFFEGLEELGLIIDDVNEFDGSFNLGVMYAQDSRDVIMASAALHATISDQLIKLDTEKDVVVMPEKDVASDDIQVLVSGTTFVLKTEIDYFFDGLEELGLIIEDVNEFDGSFHLGVMYDQESRDIIMASAALHATISDQLVKLDTEKAVVVFPDKDVDTLDIQLSIAGVVYVIKAEIDYFFEGLEELGLIIDDVNEFDGSFNLGVMYDQASRDIILASAALHATISDQLIKLDTDKDAVIVPELDVTEAPIIVTVESVDYLTKAEIDGFFEGLEELGLIIDDVNMFDGKINMTALYDVTSRTTILTSAILHATISEQLIDLDTRALVIIPDTDYAETLSIRVVKALVEFIAKDEIHAFFEAIETLGIPLDYIDEFTGTISLASFFVSEEPLEYDNNQNTLLASAIMHATISDQILDLNGSALVVPERDIAETLITATVSGTAFVSKTEIKALINSLDILGVNDITTFTGTIELDNFFSEANQNTLLASASMHATISDQILDLGDAVLIVPEKDFAEVAVRIINSVLVEFVAKAEIKALINALEILGINKVDGFTGTITLSYFFESENPATYDDNQDILLASASMHATISDQMLDLGASALIVPDTDVDNTTIRKLVETVDFIYRTEIKAIINALDLLGLTSIDSMTGAFSLAKLNTSDKQDKLLLSASMHATISDKIFAIDDDILYVPAKRQDNATAVKVEAGLLGAEIDFVVKNEIKALIDSLIIMGYGDLSSFTSEFELDEIFANPETVFLSASIQAMFSNRLLADTGGTLIVPDEYYGTTDDIRIILLDVTYIEYDELVALIKALEDLGLDDFSTFSFTPANIFLLESFATILASEIMQATISDNLLASPTLDETAPAGSGKLIVPNYFRQDITAATIGTEWIEKVELDRLLTSLKLLGISDFSDSMSGSAITTIFTDDVKRTTFMASGSIHVTTDNLLKGNANISAAIPALAKETAYEIANLTTKAEIIYFIVAVNTIGASDFTTADFSVAAIAALTPAEQDTIVTSMIVRNKITPDLETLCSNPFDPYPLTDDDYMSGAARDFLKKQSVLDIIDFYY